MISILAKLLGGSELAAWAVIALLATGAVGAAYFYVDHHGYERAATEYKATIAQMKAEAAQARADEIERQDAANNAAKATEAQRIAEMQADNQSLQDQIKELRNEAHQDPDAGKPALRAPSVQRVNKVR
ncbi:hypothetical protein G6K88_07785 [Agrobacterium rhizogenes]|uniref:hypothetical protein n=1 Tax=Rhizobium rhizogenes TaxID=359 RepID=UPI0015733D21|nr:hypothetical protein [Rhizobium rhizogenes]NTF80860.1 hypothetical protein [Rhizobium rhizogenes]NTI01918.1 hypothetical protein [Rhizobium rhizogenes]NTI08721.1 hypothetical protein [Rhizobium rhizogenes]